MCTKKGREYYTEASTRSKGPYISCNKHFSHNSEYNDLLFLSSKCCY
jgi:hypothetical protein